MKQGIYSMIIFAAGCSLFSITQSEADHYWTERKYRPRGVSEIVGTYQQNMLGYMGETFRLFSDGTFNLNVWHSESLIGNCRFDGRFILSHDSVKLNYLSYSLDSIALDAYARASIHLDNWLEDLNSSSNLYVIRKVDTNLFIIPPAAKSDFCKTAIEHKYLYYKLDSVTVGRFYLVKVQ